MARNKNLHSHFGELQRARDHLKRMEKTIEQYWRVDRVSKMEGGERSGLELVDGRGCWV